MIVTIIAFWGIFIIGFFIGYVVSEQLVSPFGLFDLKPFNCRKCCTTQTLLALYGSVAICLESWVFFLSGVILTAALALCFIITEKEKGL